MDLDQNFKDHEHNGIDSKRLHLKNIDGTIGDLVTASDFIADPSGGATQDAEARNAIDAILDLLIEQGLMDAS